MTPEGSSSLLSINYVDYSIYDVVGFVVLSFLVFLSVVLERCYLYCCWFCRFSVRLHVDFLVFCCCWLLLLLLLLLLATEYCIWPPTFLSFLSFHAAAHASDPCIRPSACGGLDLPLFSRLVPASPPQVLEAKLRYAISHCRAVDADDTSAAISTAGLGWGGEP